MNLIKKLRKEKGLTQIQFCQKLNIGQATLSGWECGKWEPDNKTLIKLADFFGVSVDYLLGRDELTPAEKVAGASLARKTEITPKEDELLYLFRCLSDPLQDSLLNVARTLSGQPGESNLHKKA